jgi:hypothetical protein
MKGARCDARITGDKDGRCRLIHKCGRSKGHSGPHGCWAHHPFLWLWVPKPGSPDIEVVQQEFGLKVEAEVNRDFGRR